MSKVISLMCIFVLISCVEEDNIDCTIENADVIFDEIPVCFDETTFSYEDFYTIVQLTEEEVQKYYPEVENTLKAFSEHIESIYATHSYLMKDCVHIEYGYYQCPHSLGAFERKVNDLHKIVFSYRSSCLAYSSLAHELMHVIEDLYLDNISSDSHTRPYFYIINYDTTEEQHNTVEYKIRERAVEALGCE